MNDQKNSVLIACYLDEEEAQAVLRAVKIHTKGIALEAVKAANGCGWDVYATWSEEAFAEANLSDTDSIYMARFVEGLMAQIITTALAKAVLELEAEK
jgi:hypothetical protein